MAKLIGFYAPAMGSGKTTCAKHLMDTKGYKLVRFAGPLKNMVISLLCTVGYNRTDAERFVDGTISDKETPIDELMGFTARRLMQTLGTEWARDTLHPHFWAGVAEAAIRKHLSAGYSVVVDDLRFANEADLLHNLGAKLVYLVRPDTSITALHASEGGISGKWADFKLVNDSSLDNLKHDLDMIEFHCPNLVGYSA